MSLSLSLLLEERLSSCLDPGLPNTDLYYAPICHEAVQKVLQKFGTAEGNFLVRQSRSHDNSFVLSLCHNNRVLNFRSVSPLLINTSLKKILSDSRIIQLPNGMVSLSNPRSGEGERSETEWTAASLEELLETHKTSKARFLSGH